MGKADNHQLPVVQQPRGSSRTFLCQRCAVGASRLFSFKCAVVLMLSVAAFFSAFFWLLPLRYKQPGFDAKSSIKLSATVQSYFQLQKPISELIPYISRLEYDVNEEIGVPSLKVAVLSMHQADLSNWNSLSNWTDVLLGFLPDPINSAPNPVALSLLKSSLIDLFLQQYNLTLTSTIFGEPSSFEILKVPGGITIIPERTPLLSLPLVNFTLNSSIYDIKENLPELKEQLKLGLHLMPNEMVYIQVTNKHGSTKDPPVMVEALVASEIPIQPERLKQLAQIITGSPPVENLGLDHSVFGKVKEISLSSFLNHSLYAPAPTPTPTPTPSPSPSPERAYHTGPSMVPSYSPGLSPNSRHALPPCPTCYAYEPSPSPHNAPQHSLSPNSGSPTPLGAQGCHHCSSDDSPSPSPTSHPDQLSPNLSPRSTRKSPVAVSSPQTSPASPPDNRSGKDLGSPLHVSSSYTYSSYSRSIRCLNGLLTFLLLLWMS
ncbi:formin-like protein 7 isoform X2 [Salvia miltiorrhiza]|uniref:formin-like protein 7 isoform X2 n=1 Tax=Salvia miltiorrhiza TaxID=226208 RepID=UPI0025ABF76E|nr:formin-like protein 7 isoform X2 [Salvia miltiorrhiza]